MAHIAWLGKKSPFCGNVTYGLSITEALRQRGHGVSFIHFDTPAAGLVRGDWGQVGPSGRTGGLWSRGSGPQGVGGPAGGRAEGAPPARVGPGREPGVRPRDQDRPHGATALQPGERDEDSPDPEVALPYLVKSQVYTIPSPGAQRELRES
ncbi:MAG: hypothetical protein ACKO0M_16145, partial [Cyanobium sp.]